MNELRVPTHATAAEIRTADGRIFVGRIFIPSSSSQHTGSMRPDEWLNQTGPFFAFLADDAKSTVLLNKQEVAVLSIAPSQDEDARAEDVDLPERRLALELGDSRIEGVLLVDMPPGQRRVLDYLNRPEPFLLLRTVDRWHLVRKNLITRVMEIEEA